MSGPAENPYEAPKAAADEETVRPARSRLRWIPAAIVFLYGAGFVLIPLGPYGMLVIVGYEFSTEESSRDLATRQLLDLAKIIPSATILGIAGVILLLSSRMWVRGPGRRALKYTVFGFLLAILDAYATMFFTGSI